MTSAAHGTALVTGASGFIGGHLAERLAEQGVEVAGLDIVPPRRALRGAIRHYEVDIRDAASVSRVIAEVRPDVVYHLAAQASVSVSMRDPVLDIEANITGTVHLARAAIEAGTRRFVFFSTGGALYGAPEVIPVDESRVPEPLSVYGASKLAAERYLALIAAPTDLEVSVVRPGNVYGPAQDPHGEAGVIAIFAGRMLKGDPVTIFGDGSQLRDYVYVADVVEAATLAASQQPDTCLVGTGVGTSTQQIFDLTAVAAGYERPPVYAAERPGDIPQIALDSTRAKRVWGWEPRVALADGLAETVEWFRRQTGQ